MEKQKLPVLPAEISKIAESVTLEKRNEVQDVLNQVFNGVAKMREQLNLVVVENECDVVNMKLANTLRLGVRQIRLDAEKLFDAKRDIVQRQMLNYKTEDTLWLKAKQIMQTLTKEIEEQARWKEETLERYKAEMHEKKIQKRMEEIQKYSHEITRVEIENMSDQLFVSFLRGLEKAHADKLEAEKKAEEEKRAREKAEEEERERVRLENEQLRKAAAEKEKQLAAEKARAEAERKALEEKLRHEKIEAERKIQLEQQAARAAAEKAAAEKARLEAELKAKNDAEIKLKESEKTKTEDENITDKQKLINLINQLRNFALPNVKNTEAKKTITNVQVLLGKIAAFIEGEIEKYE